MTSVSVLERVIGLSRSATVGGLVLVLSNLIPLAGVLWWGWDAYVVVFLYWLENGVIGVFNVLKIRREESSRQGTGRYLSNFFVFHYGAFWLGHGLFVLLLSGLSGSVAIDTFQATATPDLALPHISALGIVLALAALTVSHAGNYVFVFLREREYLRTDPMRQMLSPYPRLITLHVVIILGAILAGVLGEPVIIVILLVLFKLGFELTAFTFDRRVRTADAGMAVRGRSASR